MYVVTFAPTVPTSVQVFPSSDRSILKPSSLAELSVQVILIWLPEIPLACRFDGALSGAGIGVSVLVGGTAVAVGVLVGVGGAAVAVGVLVGGTAVAVGVLVASGVAVGVLVGGGAAPVPTSTILATEGTPFPLRTNSM